MKSKKVILGAVIVAAALSSCSAASVEELLSPPRLGEEQTAIYEALRTAAGGSVSLKYPKSGQYRSAFVVQDIDSEPTNEAIVFYEKPNVAEGSSLRINFLDMQEGKWVSVYDFSASGSEVERVMFKDLGDSETSIIITYYIQNSSDMASSVIKFSDGSPREVFSGRHSYMDVFDADGNGKEEMFLISADRVAGTAAAQTLGWREGEFGVIGSAQLKVGFSEYKNVISGSWDKSGVPAIFIDYALSDGSFSTDALICYENRLAAVTALSEAGISRRVNSYTPNLYSADIDSDGIIEIPATAPFPSYENLTKPEQVNMTIWYEIADRGTKLKEKYRSYSGIRGDFTFIIPPRWQGLVTASVSISDGTVKFSRYNAEKRETGQELLEIRSVSPDPATAPKGYISLGKSEATGYSFYAKINAGDELSLTESELKDFFIIR
ncbi:MAG: hypothetical protein ACI4KR_01105 [Ruminiclostridium sp.]